MPAQAERSENYRLYLKALADLDNMSRADLEDLIRNLFGYPGDFISSDYSDQGLRKIARDQLYREWGPFFSLKYGSLEL